MKIALSTIARRLFRFRLRTLFIFMTILAVALGLWVARIQRQIRAVAALHNHDVVISYDFQYHHFDLFGMLPPPPPGPAWLRETLGIDYVARVTAVRIPLPSSEWAPEERWRQGILFAPKPMRDDDYAQLANFASLEYITINGAPVTDATVPCIGRAKSIRYLYLGISDERTRNGESNNRIGISDAGLRHLAPLQRLERLDISNPDNSFGGPQITDEGLASVALLSNLQELSIRNAHIHGRGLRHLAKLKHLKSLDIIESPLTGDGFEHLVACKELISIGVHGGPLSDEGLRQISQIKSLESLLIWQTRISPQGLACLADLPGLKDLRIDGKTINDESIEELSKVPTLERLEIGGPNVTDAALKFIPRFPALKELSIPQSTSITDAAVRKLIADLPGLTINYSFRSADPTSGKSPDSL